MQAKQTDAHLQADKWKKWHRIWASAFINHSAAPDLILH